MLLVLYLLLSLLWHKRLIIIIKAVDMKHTILANFRILPSSYLKTAAAAVVAVVVVVIVTGVVAVSIAVVMANTAVICFISRQRKIVATNAVIITAATAAAATPNYLGSRDQIVGFWYRIYRTVCSSRTTASIAGVAGAQQISPVYMTAIMIGIKA